MSGLGISFSPELPQPPPKGRRNARPQSSYASLSSAMSSSSSSNGQPRRPASSMDRRVRIASGLPGILGAETDSDTSPRDFDADSMISLSTIGTSVNYSTKRLSAAVAAMQGQGPPSSGAGSSNGGGGGPRRKQTIRKQASQPVLSRSSTMRFPQGGGGGGSGSGPYPPVAMNRSRSQASLSSAYSSSTGVSNSTIAGGLGRTSEIPRSVSRQDRGPRRARTMDLNDAAAAANTNANAAHPSFLQPGKPRMVPDGFGGWVEEKMADNRAKPQPASARSEEQPAFDGPAIRAAEADHQAHPPRPATSQAIMRVGSFYNSEGRETAQLDADGHLSRSGTRVGAQTPSDASSIMSRGRSNSGAPRAQLMAAPEASAAPPTTSAAPEISGVGNMRSVRGWRGLEGAERGEAMVSLDTLGASFQSGEAIVPGRVATGEQESILGSARPDEYGSDIRSNSPTEVAPNDSISNVGTGTAPARPRSHSTGAATSRPRSASSAGPSSNVSGADLHRQPTLLSAGNPARRSRDLTRILAPTSNRAVKAASVISSGSSSVGSSTSAPSEAPSGNSRNGLSRSNTVASSMSVAPAVLEQGRAGKARVDVDVVLESDLVVEGGMLRGRLEIKVRRASDKAGALMLAQPKIRVVGFEELLNDDTRHIFYHHATVIDGDRSNGGPSQPYVLHGSPDLSSPQAEGREPLPCFAGAPDVEGYAVGAEGSHSIPFALELPVGKGAKGSFRGKHAVVRYIVIGSVKLKNSDGTNRSIAHFYRHVELFPYLNPAVILSSASRPVQARASKGLFLGGSGKVNLTASLHRSNWVAGQRAYINLTIDNETSKKLKSLTLALVRTVTLYRPRPEFDVGMSAPDDPTDTYVDPDACATSTSRKKISEETLEMGQKGAKGLVTARGWWTGVDGGGKVDFAHYMRLPSDALTISRGRHVEVQYSIKVSVSSSLAADVSVELPLRIINFVSLDPPPIKAPKAKAGFEAPSAATMARSWSQAAPTRPVHLSVSDTEAPMIARVRSMDALRSPQRVDREAGSLNLPIPPHVAAAAAARAQQPPQNDTRRLQHQKSLDFINHAIRSATARRGGGSSQGGPSPQGLGIDIAEDGMSEGELTPQNGSSTTGSSVSSAPGPAHPSCAPYDHNAVMQAASAAVIAAGGYGYGMPGGMPLPFVQVRSVPLDDVGDTSDDGSDVGERTINLNDDSVDEVDFVIGSARLDGGGSPEFAQHSSATAADELSYENIDEADCSTDSDATSRGPEVREEDEYDEEEERLAQQEAARAAVVKQREAQRAAQQATLKAVKAADEAEDDYAEYNAPSAKLRVVNVQDEDLAADEQPTPIARSPAKMATIPGSPAQPEPQPPRVLAQAAAVQQEHTLPRKSSNLTRTGNVRPGSRPVSPSKAAPSPTKSALKSKSSFTFATADAPLKLKTDKGIDTKPKPIPQLRAKVVLATASPTRIDASSAPSSAQSSPKKGSRSPQKPAAVKMAKTSSSQSQSAESSRSSSPTSSVASSVRTPESAHGDLSDTAVLCEPHSSGDGDEPQGLGLSLGSPVKVAPAQPIIADSPQTPRRIIAPVVSTPESERSLRHVDSSDRLQRSHSTLTLRGSSVVVPSVRDKIAALEQRKAALRDFTGRADSASPSSTPLRGGTPGSATRFSRSGSVGPESGASPSTNKLQRKASVLSIASETTASSVDDYLHRTPSVVSFRAPMLKQ